MDQSKTRLRTEHSNPAQSTKLSVRSPRKPKNNVKQVPDVTNIVPEPYDTPNKTMNQANKNENNGL
jgi:hypothetical protein